MKAIDFHIHTKPTPQKDDPFTFSSPWLADYIKKSRLDAIAITNHNLFDKEQYEDIVLQFSETKIFPGMELSLETGHVLIIAEDNVQAVNELERASAKITKLDLGASGSLNTFQFIEYFPSWQEDILIFESNKSNSMPVPDALTNALCLGGVPSQNKFQREINTTTITPVLFSDAHASDDETNSRRSNIDYLKNKHTYIDCDTTLFSDIKLALSHKESVGINPKLMNDVYDIQVDDHPLQVSTGLNLIVGRRGSGKTFLINSIANENNDNIYQLKQFDTASNRKQFLESQQVKKRKCYIS